MVLFLPMNKTTENFWAAWALPLEVVAPVFYRLYYDEQGYLLFYSMEDVPGKYIEIDHEIFTAGSPRIRVIDGKIHYVNTNVVTKLVPSTEGQACDPRDVTVVTANTNKQYWKLKTIDETH